MIRWPLRSALPLPEIRFAFDFPITTSMQPVPFLISSIKPEPPVPSDDLYIPLPATGSSSEGLTRGSARAQTSSNQGFGSFTFHTRLLPDFLSSRAGMESAFFPYKADGATLSPAQHSRRLAAPLARHLHLAPKSQPSF
jgi:hypothetical protein